LPTALRRELDAMGPNPTRGSDDDEGSDSEAEDVYEYEEGVPEEEAGKNGRYDAVDNYEYEFDRDASNAVGQRPSLLYGFWSGDTNLRLTCCRNYPFLYALVTFGVEFDKTLSAFKLHFELVKMWC
jgi:hypothetical protein